MTKLQPNYSWQKYEQNYEDQREQFQYLLQNQHINVANAVNSTIDDSSYFLEERPTGFTWVDGSQIYSITITGTITTTGANPFPIGNSGTITQIIKMEGIANTYIPLPYVDPASISNCIGLTATGTTLTINNGTAVWNGSKFYVTIYYTQTGGNYAQT